MKQLVRILVVGLGIMHASGVVAQVGGGFDLTWNTMNGGGATFVSGGGYTLGATIGQPDSATAVAGGAFTMSVGFWYRGLGHPVGDTNLDCSVDDADITNVILDYGAAPTGANGESDVNHDGIVDDADITEVVIHYGETC